jgi:cystathionine beta-lyase
MNVDFDALTLAELRRRRSAKWTAFPPDVLPAWIAEMDVLLDAPIRDALLAAIESGDTGYANARDVAPAFARFAASWFGWTVDPARVLVSPDVLAALAATLGVVSSPGAKIIVNSPVYPPFYRVIGEVARTVDNVPLRHDADGWSLHFGALERAFAGGAAAYVLCSPHNPLGTVWDDGDLARVAELARHYGVTVIADEIHAPLTAAGERHTPFLTIAERVGLGDAVALWSASKSWNLAGLKCALMVAGSEAMRRRLRAIPLDVPYGHLGVLATVTAFEQGEPWLRALCVHLDRNRRLLRDLLAERLPAIGYEPPQAGYLAWLDCSALGLEDQPVDVFLERGRVALSRGRDFGTEGAACVRLNFGTTAPILTEVVERMQRALG